MKRALVFVFALVPLSVYACSSDDTTATPVGTDAGASGDGSTATDGGASGDAPPPTDSSTATDSAQDANVPAPCSDSDLEAPGADFRGTDAGGQGAGGADISFPTGASPAQYGNRCVKIKVGQQVTFAGTFEAHPLQSFGGNTPSPIPALTNVTPDGGALVVTFPSPGTFGFHCQFHPTLMNGAVKVVP